MLTRAYSFIINKVTRSLNIFFCNKDKRCYYFSFTIYSAFSFLRPLSELVASDDDIWKVKAEYIVKEK